MGGGEAEEGWVTEAVGVKIWAMGCLKGTVSQPHLLILKNSANW